MATRYEPRKYDPQYAQIASSFALLGVKSVADLAKKMGFHHSTIRVWLREVPEFRQAWSNARQQVGGKVLRSLIDVACGYTCEATKVMNNGNMYRYMRNYPPEPAAGKYLLSNFYPEVFAINEKGPEDKTITAEYMLKAIFEATSEKDAKIAELESKLGEKDVSPVRGVTDNDADV